MVSTTRTYNDSRNLARTGLGYDGVVRITNGSFYGTGALLDDGIHILTAAHVVKGLTAGSTSVLFETSTGQQTVSVSRITTYSSYDAANANAPGVPGLLARLDIEPERFIDCATNLMKLFGRAVGAPAHLTELCVARQVKYLRGMGAAREAFERRVA